MSTPSYLTISQTVGNTPLVRLQRIPAAENDSKKNLILGKLEGNNPAGSVKDRPALSMILRAQERGEIKPGDTLILRHDQNHLIAQHRSSHRQSNASIAAGSLNESVTRFNFATLLGAQNHRQRRPVFHRPRWIITLQLS